jgi:probable poly-beta-1,6-N-acetyl-D-glucosamine export protein
MRNQTRWLEGINFFRAFAIIEIIVFHATVIMTRTNLTAPNPTQGIIIALAAFTSFGVEQFLFVSGVVLYNKYYNGFSLSTFYKKRFSAVVPPYLIWSTFYFFYPYVGAVLLFSVFHYPTVAYSSISNLALVLRGYLVGLAIGVSHLWFLVLLMQLYLLYPLLVKFYNRSARQKNPIYALSFLLFLQIVFTSLFCTRHATLFSTLFLSGIFYFVFGFVVAEHYGAIKQKLTRVSLRSISFAVLLSTLYYAVVYYHVVLLSGPVPLYYVWLYQITGPFYCLLLISFYLRIGMGWGGPHGFFTGYMEKIGEDSFGIYLTHMFFIILFLFALPMVGLSIYNLLFYPTLVFLTLMSSYLTVEAIYRLPFSAVIIGKRRKKGNTQNQHA